MNLLFDGFFFFIRITTKIFDVDWFLLRRTNFPVGERKYSFYKHRDECKKKMQIIFAFSVASCRMIDQFI